MKLYRTLKMLLITFLMAVMIPVSAYAGWLDKSVNFVKSVVGMETPLTVEEIGDGLKEALRVGAESVVKQLGKADGFNKDDSIHIYLPQSLDRVKQVLGKVGLDGMLQELELKLNRAAEAATPKARQLFLNAIAQMTLDDAKGIFNGPDDAATQYFKKTMTPGLVKEMRPVIEATLLEVGAVRTYDNMMKEYTSLPFVPDVKANLSEHVIEKAMDGIFYYMAKEEAAIRRDPARRTTELLKKVFGSQQ